MNPSQSSHLASRLLAAKRKLREQTRAVTGIEGWGAGEGHLRVYVSDGAALASIPHEVDGITVKIVPSGTIEAQEG